MPFDSELWTRSLSEIVRIIAAWLPRLAAALAWLVLGYVVARVTQYLLAGLLRRLGLDRLTERAGADRMLKEAGFESSTSGLIARLIYWLVLLVFVLAATESLGLSRVVETLGGLVNYLPSVLAAALILLLGGLIARIVGDAVGGLASQAGVTTGPLLGQLVRYVLFVFVAILALEQLKVETTLLTTTAIALIGATALTLALAFGFGSRALAQNIMAGMHAKESFSVGQRLKIRGHTGRLVSIGSVKSVIETEAGLVSLPNAALTDEEVTIVREREEAE